MKLLLVSAMILIILLLNKCYLEAVTFTLSVIAFYSFSRKWRG